MKIDENTTPLLTVDHLKQYFKVSGSFTVKAVEDVALRFIREKPTISRGIRFRKIYNRKKYHPPV